MAGLPKCGKCGLSHVEDRGDGTDCLAAQRQVVYHLLNQIGEATQCKGCRAMIWWVTHNNGRKACYNDRGQNHFADCPNREDFKKKAV